MELKLAIEDQLGGLINRRGVQGDLCCDAQSI